MDSTLFLGLSQDDLITLLAGAAAFIAVLAVWNAALAHNPMRGRLKVLEARRTALRAGYIAPQKRRTTSPRINSVGMMRQLVNKVNLLGSEQARKTGEKLAEAGWRSKDAIVIFLFFKLVLPLLIAVVSLVAIYVLKMVELQPMSRLAVTVGATLLAALAPDMVVKNTIMKRRDLIRKAMPDGLDLLVICAEAGLTLDAALNRVSRELGKNSPELADELSLTSIELGFLPDRKQALDNLAKRVNEPAMRSVVATLNQTERYGTPLAQSLRVLASEFRNERLMKAEERAARLPAILTVPLIIFILPTLFIVLMGPAIIQVLDTFK
jgi:tight adherence protein C